MKKVIFVFVLLFLMSFISAGFEIGNQSSELTKTYGQNQNIMGWVNISLDNELSNSLLSDSNGNSIELLKLLNKTDYSYTCNPLGCESDYKASNPKETKSFTLSSKDERIYGLKFSSDITSIDSVSFDLTSNAPESCSSQVKIDILNNGKTNAINEILGSGLCEKNYGCFDKSETTEDNIINSDSQPYCQKINISETPSVNIGAWIKKVNGDLDITMELHDSDGKNVGKCVLSGITKGEESCSIDDYAIQEKEEHTICIYSSASGSGEYKIKGYSLENGCGYYGHQDSSEKPDSAYSIFAIPNKFGGVSISVGDELQNGEKVSSLIEDYIVKTYGSLDCSSGCIVPIKINSYANQNIELKNLLINYKASGLKESRNFYDLEEIPAKINSDFGKLFLNKGNFSVPDTIGKYSFELNLNDSLIVSEELSVKELPTAYRVTPDKTASALPTLFEAKINNSENLSKITWNFGDNSSETTTINKVEHTYSNTGNYTLELVLEDDSGRMSKSTFSIEVGLPDKIIQEKLNETTKRKKDITLDLINFDSYSKNRIEDILNLNNASSELDRIKKEYNSGNHTEEELNNLLRDLLSIDLPEAVFKGVSADDLTFYPDENYVDLDIVSEITEEDYNYSDEEKYIESLIAWNQINLKNDMDFSEFYRIDSGTDSEILSVYEITIKEREDISGYYFVMENLEGLDFESKSAIEKGNYIYIPLDKSSTIKFSTTENIDFSELPVFISPKISELSIDSGENPQPDDKTNKWLIFGLIIFGVILIAVFVYFGLHAWYQKKYEDKLFKNKTDLYNLINYVQNSLKKGLSKKEITKNLKKSKWSSEQINYVMKKYAGKKIGMPGLPVKKS